MANLPDDSLVLEITSRILSALSAADGESIPIGVSARHVHLSEACLHQLFGEGYTLTPGKSLMGGQFAAQERITVVGANLKAIENVRIIGPLRHYAQAEISRTDGHVLGINPPVRDSGDLAGAAPITLVGPRGVVYLESGCIVAKRHVHMSPKDAAFFQVADGDSIHVALCGGRGGLMHHVLVRVAPSYTLEMHIDTDEANAFGVAGNARGKMVKNNT